MQTRTFEHKIYLNEIPQKWKQANLQSVHRAIRSYSSVQDIGNEVEGESVEFTAVFW
jgi:hypothetical protein